MEEKLTRESVARMRAGYEALNRSEILALRLKTPEQRLRSLEFLMNTAKRLQWGESLDHGLAEVRAKWVGVKNRGI